MRTSGGFMSPTRWRKTRLAEAGEGAIVARKDSGSAYVRRRRGRIELPSSRALSRSRWLAILGHLANVATHFPEVCWRCPSRSRASSARCSPRGQGFSVTALMGILMVVGIAVSNGILLVDDANRRFLEGADAVEAAIAAAGSRFVPIMMTSLATVIGLVPTAIALEKGTEANQPLALAVVGGCPRRPSSRCSSCP